MSRSAIIGIVCAAVAGIGLLVCCGGAGLAWVYLRSDRQPAPVQAAPAVANKDQDARRHVEASAGFSFVPPTGWAARPVQGVKYKVVAGPAAAGFAPNINVVDESFPGPLAAYVNGNLAAMRQQLKGFRLLQQSDFKTTEGLAGARFTFENQQNGRMLRQTSYFFANGDRKFVVTCTALADGGDRLDAVFESSMKTFRFERQ